jgi:ketosteroid isomerase-like protein
MSEENVMVSLEEGPLYGQDAVWKNYERWIDVWDAPEINVEEIIGETGQVFVRARFRARERASGAAVDSSLFEVYTLRNGKIIRVDEFRDKAAVLAAAGLSE